MTALAIAVCIDLSAIALAAYATWGWRRAERRLKAVVREYVASEGEPPRAIVCTERTTRHQYGPDAEWNARVSWDPKIKLGG